ncbi:WD40/YVTN/BNR-like repeat-containing protein [Sediminicola luteus]|uniref:Oxidoreductase n=1 Tax=Sediminicola luteus TaxID=319238 RepID=A0A2A4G3A6_9FLAO|nr:oxidoreductase [Sediminicola luteus]PCE62464.1 oxidoreductase [Sediminicola luteus]
MRYLIPLVFLFVFGCEESPKPKPITQVKVDTVFEDDSLSIRAIQSMPGAIAFAANNGVFGTLSVPGHQVRSNVMEHEGIRPSFRAVAATSTDFFMLSIANPALLYKTGDNGKMELVYQEEGEGVFYDSMAFWNDLEGLAIGDTVDGCLSVIITRDGGKTWVKQDCKVLPEGIAEEGAFAASDTNIAIQGQSAWVATTTSRVLVTHDIGRSWSSVQTPIVKEKETQGIYSLDFYDDKLGMAIGGDYLDPENKSSNLAITKDGGESWQLLANGAEPNYKSCVQFVPNSNGTQLVALGFTGISVSNTGGVDWEKISDEPFYTLRFINDSTAYAAGKGRISKLIFR